MRDLRTPCIHGRYEAHQFAATYAEEPEPCPGGREVTIDYEALVNKAAIKLEQFHALTERFARVVASESIGFVADAIEGSE